MYAILSAIRINLGFDFKPDLQMCVSLNAFLGAFSCFVFGDHVIVI